MKKIYLFMTIILVVFLSACGTKKETDNSNSNKKSNTTSTSDLNVVTSLEDTITNNTVWCGTFNLVWNDLKENYIKQDIIINPPKEIVTNLNKATFNKSYLDENSYYTKFGKQTPALKKEIEENIKKKFNQTSDILDKFVWEENSDLEFIYAMLYKKFTFATPFSQLENKDFNYDEGSYRYFGITKSKRDGANQVEVLYYDDYDNNAVKILTNENDEIILVKSSNNANNFLEIYNNIINKSKTYTEKTLNDVDTLLIPYIKFDTYKEFKELENLKIPMANGYEFEIKKAVQSIKMQLNESGGDIKSEAAVSGKVNSAYIPEQVIRNFNYNTTFVMFLKEKNMDMPYFAAQINDLKLYQKSDK